MMMSLAECGGCRYGTRPTAAFHGVAEETGRGDWASWRTRADEHWSSTGRGVDREREDTSGVVK